MNLCPTEVSDTTLPSSRKDFNGLVSMSKLVCLLYSACLVYLIEWN